MRELELLSPAANKEVAIQAILHGADAVYMGGPSHGARSKASNSIEDIKEVVCFAHQYRAKVYVTVNTLVYEDELAKVEELIRDLYFAGVDALIVQDMGILRMNIPPIQLHASTQCDTRSVAKAEFLERVGFSQIVLARELTLKEISEICEKVNVPVECFIHGALCVSYSGRCQASERCLGRSANRGECGQMCRMSYSLKNADGEEIIKNRYLLSLSDFNSSEYIEDLIKAGVSSFKIEGRLKDSDYVKNVTAAYRKLIDGVIASHPDKYKRSSFGASEYNFIPNLEKSFNRGFTDYFLPGRTYKRMASILTPKSLGERIKSVNELNNGDGISYFTPKKGEFEGVRVNRVENGKIIAARRIDIPKGVILHRTYDIEWEKKLSGNTANRKISLDITLNETGIEAIDERGLRVCLPLNVEKEEAKKEMDIRHIFAKTGNTIYKLRNFTNNLKPTTFIPASVLTSLRRELLSLLDKCNESTYLYQYRKGEDKNVKYLSEKLESSDNVSNRLAREFYHEHGIKEIEDALEVNKKRMCEKDVRVMTTRYCLRRELGCCKKNPSDKRMNGKMKEPLTLTTGRHSFRLEFDCKNCEMHVISPKRQS
ncbi:MAG: U32 family peptidase [Muribaculaceae bacterium]|nr:U32 family peptidase [Muribaculaceae bacterium]